MLCLLRIEKITFDFTLGAFYKTGIIESNNGIEAEFAVNVALENELHSSEVHVSLHLYPTLTRICRGHIRGDTVLDIFVLILLLLSTIAYVISTLNAIKLTRVCMYVDYGIRMYMCYISYIIHTYIAFVLINLYRHLVTNL